MANGGGDWLSDDERRRLTRQPSDRLIVATLASTGLIASFMQTLVIPIVPRLPQLLDTGPADASWVLTATLVAAAIATPIAGRLGDMYGKRRILLVLLAAMAVGSVVSALSDTLLPMVVGRSLQGVGMGAISLGISILRDVLHRRSLGAAIALVSATLGVGGGLGLPVAALIADNLDYHALFWLSAILALLALLSVALVIPVSTLRTGGRFDFVGALGFAIVIVAALLVISKGSEWGWRSLTVLGLLGGASVVLAAWIVWELRTRDPLVDLRVAVRRTVLLTNLASVSVGFAFFITAASLPVLLESPTASGVGMGQTILLASLCLMPNGIAMFLAATPAARLAERHGPKSALLLGIGIIAVTFTAGAFLLEELWQVIAIATLSGLGTGFAYAAMPTLIMRAVPTTETAAANGLNSVMRTLGSSTAAAIVGVLLAGSAIVIDGVSVPTGGAFQATFLVGAAVAIAGGIVAAFIPRHDHRYEETASIPVQNPSD
jgi:MFS family permease